MELIGTDENPVPAGACVEAIRTADGLTIRCARWRPAAEPSKGTVLLFQGRTEFIEKYFETVADLMRRGFAVVAFDWRGQGGSDRLVPGRCHVETFEDYDRDLDSVWRHVVLPDCPPPIFALAHSMGSLVCLRATKDGRARFTRMVLTAPMLALSRESAPPMGAIRFTTGLGLFLGRDNREAANRSLKARDEPVEEVRQQRIVELLRLAPVLKTGRPTVRWVYSATRAMQATESPEFAQAIKQPTLLIVAGRDRVVSNDAIENFTREMQSGAQIVLAGARHEVLMEDDVVRRQFWAAFDAFVPGGDPDRQ